MPRPGVEAEAPAGSVDPTMLQVEFTRHHGKFNSGEQVNLLPGEARRLVRLGVARAAGVMPVTGRDIGMVGATGIIRK